MNREHQRYSVCRLRVAHHLEDLTRNLARYTFNKHINLGEVVAQRHQGVVSANSKVGNFEAIILAESLLLCFGDVVLEDRILIFCIGHRDQPVLLLILVHPLRWISAEPQM